MNTAVSPKFKNELAARKLAKRLSKDNQEGLVMECCLPPYEQAYFPTVLRLGRVFFGGAYSIPE